MKIKIKNNKNVLRIGYLFLATIILEMQVCCLIRLRDFNQFTNQIQAKDDIIIQQETTINELHSELLEWEKVCKDKDDKIIELENKLSEYEHYARIGSMSIPNIGNTKTYMSYRMIKRNSNQGNIVYSDEAWTDQDGLRLWEEYYCVALGSYYGAVGDKFWVETDKGNKYKIIKADEKADAHTDPSNKYTVATNCMMEWLVDIDKLNVNIKNSGDINNIDKVSGKIVKIVKIEE